jgi:hypothetical protein
MLAVISFGDCAGDQAQSPQSGREMVAPGASLGDADGRSSSAPAGGVRTPTPQKKGNLHNAPHESGGEFMRNITVSITDEVYRQARVWAAENNTSVSAAVEYMLENVRSILQARKPPHQPRRNNRFPVPPSKNMCDLNREDVMNYLNRTPSRFSVRAARSRTEFSQL